MRVEKNNYELAQKLAKEVNEYFNIKGFKTIYNDDVYFKITY